MSSPTPSTYYNPILPGWHSDPSCIYHAASSTFFCCTSTFLVTPGLPVYASKDLVNWKLASHALTRKSQIPYMNTSTDQNDGIFAPTLRYHNGVFYVIVVYVFRAAPGGVYGLIFKSKDPWDLGGWSEPVKFEAAGIDPDLFWDDDGTVYMTSTDITQGTIDIDTGALGPRHQIWHGTGGVYPEGPHMYKKDGFYYLMIGEGGTETNHSVTMARATAIGGPYESYGGNPVLTAKGTPNYFQTVGHADLFQDAAGNWWAVALSTRSGPQWVNYPMGRETILTPVTWKKGEFPSMKPVFGKMQGWPLPAPTRKLPGKGPFLGDPDVYDFAPGSTLPLNLVTWRWPKPDAFHISAPGHPNTLRLKPSPSISAPDTDIHAGADGLSLLLRLQTDTFFTFSVDVSFHPTMLEEEAGVTVFLTQRQHIDLGIVMLPAPGPGPALTPHLRLRATTVGALPGTPSVSTVTKAVPKAWLGHPISLQAQAASDTQYTFSAASSRDRQSRLVVGSAPATIVSGGSGPFTGTLVGVYATNNNLTGTTESYISRWRYKGDGQKIDFNVVVPSGGGGRGYD